MYAFEVIDPNTRVKAGVGIIIVDSKGRILRGSFPVDMEKRKELSLPEIKVPDMAKLRKLIKETTDENSDEECD